MDVRLVLAKVELLPMIGLDDVIVVALVFVIWSSASARRSSAPGVAFR